MLAFPMSVGYVALLFVGLAAVPILAAAVVAVASVADEALLVVVVDVHTVKNVVSEIALEAGPTAVVILVVVLVAVVNHELRQVAGPIAAVAPSSPLLP